MWHRIGKGGQRKWGKKGAGILFTDGQHVLLLRRSDKGDNNGAWDLPGGKSKEGENPIDTATREAKEECGALTGHRFDKLTTEDGHHVWVTFFYSVKKPFSCHLSDEHSEYKWVDIPTVKTMNLHPKLQDHWPSYLNRINRKFQPNSFKEWLSRS